MTALAEPKVLNVPQAMDQAVAHQLAGRLGEAESLYRRILTLRPDSAPTYCNLGNVLAAKGRIDQAILCFQQAMLVQPDFTDAAHNLATVCMKAGRSKEAVVALRDLLRLRPGAHDVHNSLGIALCNLNRFDEAINHFRHALTLKPENTSVYNNLGNALCAIGLYDEAIGSYHRALVYRPNYPAAHLNLGMLLLLKENFVRGWPEYEWRWRLDDPRARLLLNTPWWDGSPLRGRTILLHNEQGFGDTIQMSRYIPQVAAQGARLLFMCQPPLVELLRKLDGISHFVFPNQPVPPHDVHCPMLTLPGVMGTTHLTIPNRCPYLKADAERVRQWSSRMPSDRRLKVGLVWAGQPSHANDHNRSVGLAKLAPFGVVDNVWLCSLQKGKAAQQIYDRSNSLRMQNWEKDLRDFSDTAALIANLDLVICVDTAVAHLAGALGKPVWLMLPFVPDWRWMLGRSDSPWYPSMRVFRQASFGDWESLISQVRKALSEKALEHGKV